MRHTAAPHIAAGMPAGPQRRAFTLIELLVVVAIIAVLAAMGLAGLSALRDSARRTQATEMVQMLHVAMREYAASDRRHLFPDERTDRLVAYAGSGAPQLLDLLEERAGYKLKLAALAPPDASGVRVMHDPWGRPMRYQLDDWTPGRIDPDPLPTSSVPPVVLGPPVRPVALADWNPRGDRPYAYVWSRGRDDSADGRGWIYIAETP